MAIADRVNILNKKLEKIVQDNSEEIYGRITWEDMKWMEKMVIAQILEKEKEAKEKDEYFSDDYKSDKYIKETATKMYYEAVQKKLDAQWLAVEFHEGIRDWEEVLVYTVTKKIKEYVVPIKFDYTLEVQSIKSVKEINTCKWEYEQWLEEVNEKETKEVNEEK